MAAAKPKFLDHQVPVVRILEQPELSPAQLTQVLREINDRQFGAVLQVLIEAKFKAESMLRDDSVMVSAGKVTYYMGWVAYSDYTIGSLLRLRELTAQSELEPHPGPQD